MQQTQSADTRRRPPLGTVALGIALVVLGVVWFLDVLGAIDLRWALVLPASLLAVGVALVALAGREPPGWLYPVGIVLTVLVIGQITAPDIDPLPGIGDRTERPSTLADVEPSYGLGIGSIEIDLSDVDFDDSDGEPFEIEANVAIGEIVVRLPADVNARIDGHSLIGEVVLVDEERSGLNADADLTLGTSPPDLLLDLTIGIGAVEVTQ